MTLSINTNVVKSLYTEKNHTDFKRRKRKRRRRKRKRRRKEGEKVEEGGK